MSKLIAINAACIVMIAGCQTPNFTELTRCDPNKPIRYFQNFGGGYSMPFKPAGKETSEAEAKQKRAYCMAQYDNSGKLATLTSYYCGSAGWKIGWQTKYFYNTNDILIKTIFGGPGGNTLEWYFDEHGRFVKSIMLDKQGNLVDTPSHFPYHLESGR